jgi:predicted metal-binding membrane protein
MRRWLTAAWLLASCAPGPALLVSSSCGWLLVLAWPTATALAMPFCGKPQLAAQVLADLRLATALVSPTGWLAGWVVMLLAMTPPLLAAPVARLWRGSLRRRRAGALGLFFAAYAAAWLAGAAALQALAVVLEALFGPAALVVAGAGAVGWWRCPWRRVAVDGCHRAPVLRVFGAAASWDGLAYGLGHGGWCVLACWPLMLAPLVAGGAQLGVMAASAAVMVVDRYWPRTDPVRWANPPRLRPARIP